ncbi:MAG TPA: hypothetical protein VN328_10595 [Thermodesulfovibrionales bacterium]|nr:hypothetical protein [Thermodesulfovibrionales bacterium]
MVFTKLVFFLAIGIMVYVAIRMIRSVFGKPGSPASAVVLPPTKTEIDINITDTGRDGMPVIAIRSNGATLNIKSVKQDAGQYVISTEKQADNVAVIFVDKKTPYLE